MKRLSIFIILFLLVGLGFAFTFSVSGEITVYIVRHAEKESSDPKNQDPDLSVEGKERAEALALKLKDKKITAAFATKYKRTNQTLSPSAKNNGIEVQIYGANDSKGLAELIKSKYNKKKVLIAGHSNTVLDLVEAFGGKRPVPALSEEDYDFFFELKIDRSGKVFLSTQRYGKTHHKTELN